MASDALTAQLRCMWSLRGCHEPVLLCVDVIQENPTDESVHKAGAVRACLTAILYPGPKLKRTNQLSLSDACLRLHSRDQGIDLQIVGTVETIFLDTRKNGLKSPGEPTVDEGPRFTPGRNLSFDGRP